MGNINRCNSIEDLNRLARKSIPGVIYDYIEGGSEDELTMARNRAAFLDYEFVPQALRDVKNVDLTTAMQGTTYAMPLFLAPTGMSRLFHYKGETAVAQAAKKRSLPYALSTVSTVSIEDIAKISGGSHFFQIYVWQNRDLVYELIDRCKKMHYTGVILAVDCACLGKRERDLRNGHGRPLEMKIRTALGGLTRPGWVYRFLTSEKLRLANMVDHLPHGGDALKTIERVNEQFDASVTWEDAAKMRDSWDGPFLLKGIQCVEDCKKAVEIGATGVVLSNHGGRQLDGAPPAITLLPDAVAATGGQLEIFIDGGVRRGADVIKAMALGATGCMIGRPYLYGLAAGGEKGVDRSLRILEEEMVRVMQLIGCDAVHKLNAGYVKKIR